MKTIIYFLFSLFLEYFSYERHTLMPAPVPISVYELDKDLSVQRVILLSMLKLYSLLVAWLFWTFHTKSHNMKSLVILSHSWSPFLQRTCLYGKYELLQVSMRPSGVFSREKKLSSDYPCKSHDHDHHWAVLVMAWLL